MKIIILLCVAVIIAAYGFLQWSGSNIGVAKSGRASDIAPLKKPLESVLGIQMTDLQGKVASGASSFISAISRSVETSIEEMVRGQVIDHVLRLYDQLGTAERARVKEYVCPKP
ncbi:MAG: hypothetical protein AAB508_04035 [Patescibacteria group bacterium]